MDVSWSGPSGDALALRIVGYAAPARVEGSDANWLVLEVTARNWTGAWSAATASLYTFDLPDLAAWLGDAAAGSQDRGWISREGDVCMESIGRSRGRVFITVRLCRGLENPIPAAAPGTEADVLLVALSDEELEASKGALLSAAERFPARGGFGGRNTRIGAERREERRRRGLPP